MQLTIAGREVDLHFEDLEPATSQVTGRPLRRRALDFRAGDEISDDVDQALSDARSGDDDLTDGEGVTWKVATYSSSYNDQQPGVQYDVELVEIEHFTVDEVEIDGMRFPVDYWEAPAMDETAIVWHVEFMASVELCQAIDNLHDGRYFGVAFIGSGLPTFRARTGKPLWQTVDGGRKYRVYLVADEDTPTGGRGHGINMPELANTGRIALEARARTRALLDELVAAGALSSEAVDRVMAAGQAAPDDDNDLYETSNLESYR